MVRRRTAVCLAGCPSQQTAQLLDEIDRLRYGTEPVRPEAIDEAKSLLSGVHCRIPEAEAFEINQGVQVVRSEGNLHVRLFCSGLGSCSYIYKATTESKRITIRRSFGTPTKRLLSLYFGTLRLISRCWPVNLKDDEAGFHFGVHEKIES